MCTGILQLQRMFIRFQKIWFQVSLCAFVKIKSGWHKQQLLCERSIRFTTLQHEMIMTQVQRVPSLPTDLITISCWRLINWIDLLHKSSCLCCLDLILTNAHELRVLRLSGFLLQSFSLAIWWHTSNNCHWYFVRKTFVIC